MRYPIRHGLTALSAVLAVASAAMAQPGSAASSLVTLGTNSGPIPKPLRSEPANLLTFPGHAILVDAGDGVAEQLGKAGVSLGRIDAIFITHLHFDHTGGLFGFMGMRSQAARPPLLTIYGPPGTKRMVEGLLEAMQPGAEVGVGLPGQVHNPPQDDVRVIEIGDGAKVMLGVATVTAAANSHYSFPAGSPEAARFQSLSLRFDLPDRTIAFTGDTGPSAKVEQLARGADILVSEVINVEAAMGDVRLMRPDAPAGFYATIRQHFVEQHLAPEQVGLMARRAGVKRVVLSHNVTPPAEAAALAASISAVFGGPVTAANDLDRF